MSDDDSLVNEVNHEYYEIPKVADASGSDENDLPGEVDKFTELLQRVEGNLQSSETAATQAREYVDELAHMVKQLQELEKNQMEQKTDLTQRQTALHGQLSVISDRIKHDGSNAALSRQMADYAAALSAAIASAQEVDDMLNQTQRDKLLAQHQLSTQEEIMRRHEDMQDFQKASQAEFILLPSK